MRKRWRSYLEEAWIPDKAYFHGLLTTLRRGDVEGIIERCIRRRGTLNMERQHNAIVLPNIVELLQSVGSVPDRVRLLSPNQTT